jgi:hypothetical protein
VQDDRGPGRGADAALPLAAVAVVQGGAAVVLPGHQVDRPLARGPGERQAADAVDQGVPRLRRDVEDRPAAGRVGQASGSPASSGMPK